MSPNGLPTTLAEIDLTPLAGRTYFDCTRDWTEEFIYFLLVDRFHDSVLRQPVSGQDRSAGFQVPDDFYGGTIRGITDHLDYIAGLGCTAVWLSPIFENRAGAYHGYNIRNYLAIDPHFGTKDDLIALTEAAHRRDPPIRIILDVVINHSGDNWGYPGDFPYYYSNGTQFPFGFWREPDRPVPLELRNPAMYHRRGQIASGAGWDAPPECEDGDIVTLKDYANDDTQTGSDLIHTLIKAHAYWIREADVDGFRVDAVKHMGALACSRFCSNIREYARSLGKRKFFLFGEVASADDELLDRYIGQNTSTMDAGKTVFFGLDSVLDFRLARDLPWVLKGFRPPQPLFDRLDAQGSRALNRGELGRFLVTFVDNHDSFWQPGGRFANGAPDSQVIGAVGFLLCALGTACLYYGTEQGFEGHGGDNQIREAMFDKAPSGKNRMNTQCRIYREVAAIARVTRESFTLRFGRMYYREISGDGVSFGLPYGTEGTLAFSRVLYPHEVLVAYNISSQPRHDCIQVDATFHRKGDRMMFRYGGTGSVTVNGDDGQARYVTLDLAPHQFVILE